MTTPPSIGSSQRELQTALYTACRANYPLDKVLHQEDLESLKVIPENNVQTLMACAQALTNQHLFRIFQVQGRLGWKTVKEEDAAKYSNLTSDERLIYSHIDSSTTTGIWTKNLKLKTNLHQALLSRCLKSLETKCLIKTIRNVKQPHHKIYMTFGRQPNEDVTGGAWFTDGKLDEPFIHDLGQWVVSMVASKSWVADTTDKSAEAEKGKTTTVKGDAKGKGKEVESVEPNANKLKANAKRKGREVEIVGPPAKKLKVDAKGKGKEVEILEPPAKKLKSKANTTYLPYPAGYTGYPTVEEITLGINASGVVDVVMDTAHVQQLLDVLCFDGRLVKVRAEDVYKSVRSPARLSAVEEESALTDTPCGRCPVIDICEEGGPINPGNCDYYQDWLEIF